MRHGATEVRIQAIHCSALDAVSIDASARNSLLSLMNLQVPGGQTIEQPVQ